MKLFKTIKGHLITKNKFVDDDGVIMNVAPLNVLDFNWVKEYPVECYICLLGSIIVGVSPVENIDE